MSGLILSKYYPFVNLQHLQLKQAFEPNLLQTLQPGDLVIIMRLFTCILNEKIVHVFMCCQANQIANVFR